MEDFLKENGAQLIVQNCEQYAIKTSDGIFSAIREKLDTGFFKEVLFDFTETTYVSSAGLRHFSSLLQKCDENSITLAITNISEDVKVIFEMSGYGQALKFI